MRIRFKMGRRDINVVNIVMEVSPKIREILLQEGRAYIDFAACRVADHLAISRCFKCKAYGHIAKYCKKAIGNNVCSHCG